VHEVDHAPGEDAVDDVAHTARGDQRKDNDLCTPHTVGAQHIEHDPDEEEARQDGQHDEPDGGIPVRAQAEEGAVVFRVGEGEEVAGHHDAGLHLDGLARRGVAVDDEVIFGDPLGELVEADADEHDHKEEEVFISGVHVGREGRALAGYLQMTLAPFRFPRLVCV